MKLLRGFVWAVGMVGLVVWCGCPGGGTTRGFHDMDAQEVQDTGDGVGEGVLEEEVGLGEGVEGLEEGVGGGEEVVSECPGGLHCACKENGDCFSGFCVETMEGRECTVQCLEEGDCPQGWSCAVCGAMGGDPVYCCVPPFQRLCQPCREDHECVPLVGGGGKKYLCIEFGPEGKFCGVECEGESGCPEGFECVPVAVGGGEVGQCRPAGGEACPCTKKHVSGGYLTECYIENEFGRCYGERRCDEACRARVPVEEACNLEDDDCDGKVDDGVPGRSCEVKNAYGSCEGVTLCAGGQEVCQGPEPKPEVCNGADEDCDGETDEGFVDLDGDGVADCVDEDVDGDGVANGEDNCPGVGNAGQEDLDQDGLGDACDGDDDQDTVADQADNCPVVANKDQKDTDGDGQGDACDGDLDGDGVVNGEDNCAERPNPGQEDLDGDLVGDACDADADGDGVLDAGDNCIGIANPGQEDVDQDGLGDACDGDLDGDGVENAGDNCEKVWNPAQQDTDGDGEGDACDGDLDGDGVENEEDNCAGTYNPDQADENGNGIGDACEGDWDGDGVGNEDDNCPWASNADQGDMDLDGVGDACDCDVDGDGVGNEGEDREGEACPLCAPCDNCRLVANPGQEDLDQDGLGDACDGDWDGDGDPNETDCAPEDGAVFHGQEEVCNGVEDDCDGVVDEEGAGGCLNYYFDEDGDGWGVTLVKCLCGASGEYRALRSGDCNDRDEAVHPEAMEACGNGKDDNCNGSENDEGSLGCVTYYTDLDGDGYGVGNGKCLCTSVGDLTAKTAGDCDDQDAGRSPGLSERCGDGKDNDCDGEVDEEGCQGCTTYYKDADQDRYGVTEEFKCLGQAVYPYTALVGGDCEDEDANIRPGASEVCNGKDDNCDGATDPSGTTGCQFFYPDVDGDGYGANVAAVCLCEPSGVYRATVAEDCNDNDGEMNPTRPEVCDQKDNNCNGQVDEGVTGTYFKDADQDGWGVAGDSKALCAPAAPYTASQSGDCDDSDPARYPTNPEVCDGKDNNCNGQVDEGVRCSRRFTRTMTATGMVG